MKIEFSGMLDGAAKKFAVKRANKSLMQLFLLIWVGLLPATLFLFTYNNFVCRMLAWMGAGVLGLSTVLIVGTLIVNAARGNRNVCDCSVVIEDGEISYRTGKTSDKKPVDKALKVVDYGEFYYILFAESFAAVDDCICQKSLLRSGTTEEFEKLFEDKIQSANK